jgi:hypothetical protein
MQIFLPDSRTETKTEDTINTGVHCNCLWPWDNKSYLHRFKLADNPTCPCNEGAQTSEHLIYICKILETQRKTLKQNKDQQRNLAHHKQRLGRKVFTCVFKLHQIGRFPKTTIASTVALSH